ncbi:hypothetical protein PULV_b0832 [Pseudoalteromonas ulvae UL12]|nr:hypothetical protein [Pseudoalteromonas ulvae UL12]
MTTTSLSGVVLGYAFDLGYRQRKIKMPDNRHFYGYQNSAG